MATSTEILVSSIRVVNRARADLGDLAALAESIAARGLLNPVIVDRNHYLICGHRRLEAVRSLGHETIESRIVDTANDTLEALLMESDENELRKPFTPSEAIAMKKLIEGKFKAEGKARQVEAGSANLPRNKSCASSGYVSGTKGETREKIARAIGIGSHYTMRKAEEVIKHGIPELVEAMDSGEVKINTAAYVAALPVEQQREAVAKGPEGIKDAARRAAKPKKKNEPKQQNPPEAVSVDQAPQLSALVMRSRIMSDMAYIHAGDPNAIRVLTEVRDLCNQKIEQFSTGKTK